MISEHVYVNVYAKYKLQRMIQIKNMNSFGSFLYFVFFKRVLYCWSMIFLLCQNNIIPFMRKKTNKNNNAGTVMGYNAGIHFYSRMVNISGIPELRPPSSSEDHL